MTARTVAVPVQLLMDLAMFETIEVSEGGYGDRLVLGYVDEVLARVAKDTVKDLAALAHEPTDEGDAEIRATALTAAASWLPVTDGEVDLLATAERFAAWIESGERSA